MHGSVFVFLFCKVGNKLDFKVVIKRDVSTLFESCLLKGAICQSFG